jgi:hypothetical protein
MQAWKALSLGGQYYAGVAIVDGSGHQITSFGGGTQYATAAAHGSSTGTLAMVDDGTYIRSMSGDSSGHPHFDIWGSGGTALGSTNGLPVRPVNSTGYIPDDSAVGASLNFGENPVLTGCYFETTPTSISTTQKGQLHCTANQGLLVSTVDSSGGDMTDPTNHALKMEPYQAGTAVAAGAGLYVQPGTSTTWVPGAGTNIIGSLDNSTWLHYTAVSNGVSDVQLVAANASYFVEVVAISINNTNSGSGTSVNLCDGTCQSVTAANYVQLPAPSSGSSATANTTGVGGAVMQFPAFRTSAKNHAINFALTGALTTSVTVSIWYRQVAN